MGKVFVLRQGAVALKDPPPIEEKSGSKWLTLASEFHVQVRAACQRITLKVVAADLGVEECTVSNWLACTPGRGFPPPRLILYLLAHPLVGDELARWMMSRAGYLPPVRPFAEARLAAIEQALARNPDTQRAIYESAFGVAP